MKMAMIKVKLQAELNLYLFRARNFSFIMNTIVRK